MHNFLHNFCTIFSHFLYNFSAIVSTIIFTYFAHFCKRWYFSECWKCFIFVKNSTPLVESLTFKFNFITPPHPNHHHKQYFWAAGKLCTLLILKILLFGEATILLIDPFPGKTPINYFCKLELPSVFVYLRNFWRKYRWSNKK